MPWMETSPVDQRERFIRDHRLDLYAMAELCTRYGVSRKTGYKSLGRFEEGGRLGLRDSSRAPHHCPHRMGRDVSAVICAARRQHPSWGPAKLLAWLQLRHSDLAWPAVSIAGDLLARRGLVKKRRRRRHWQHPGVVPAVTTQPNDLWTDDFTGLDQRNIRSAGLWTPVEDAGVDHRRAYVVVTEKLLDGADVVAVLQQVGGERVTGSPQDASRCRKQDTARVAWGWPERPSPRRLGSAILDGRRRF